MSNIDTVNVGGIDYGMQDTTARTNANTALNVAAYVENGNTASQAYSVIGTPINWKGTLYYTKTTVAAGNTWQVGTNLTASVNLGKMMSSIKTYVGNDGKLHFTDLRGADTVLPFSGSDLVFTGIAATYNTSLAVDVDDYVIVMWNTANAYNSWRNQVVNMTTVLELAQWDYPVVYKVTAQNPQIGVSPSIGTYTVILINV